MEGPGFRVGWATWDSSLLITHGLRTGDVGLSHSGYSASNSDLSS